MSFKPSLTRAPSVPALVRRAIPVAVVASVVTGCGGDPGAPLLDAGISVSPDAPSAPVVDAGISLDAAIEVSDAGTAPTDDAR